ncbi:MAG: helix-turn-helix transcriptional regulator [Nannocystaceae bacterium]
MPLDSGDPHAEFDPRRAASERRYMGELGQRLRTIREERDLTQHALAKVSGIAADMISRLENGHYTTPGLRTLLRLADALGVGVAELLPETLHEDLVSRETHLRARLSAAAKQAGVDELEMIVGIVDVILVRRPRE